MGNTKILCVDDDEKVLAGIERQQDERFDITTAIGPEEALETIEKDGPFAIVLTDMRMPGMNGVELLTRVRETHPDSVRMILTGYAELNSTIEAVNDGNIFRFLSKPCNERSMSAAFEAGLRQYALIEAEKELVEGTLQGSVKVLSDVLSLVNPLAFGQTNRIRTTVEGMLNQLDIENDWQIQIATMLSSLGCISLPKEILEKKFSGEKLTAEEADQFRTHPAIGSELIRAIPRLEPVADIIACQNVSPTEDYFQGVEVPRGSRILRMATEFDFIEMRANSSLEALNEFKNEFNFDDELTDALANFVNNDRNGEYSRLMICEIREGMVLAEDIRNNVGTLLMSKGQYITKSAKRLLDRFAQSEAIEHPIEVVVAEQGTTLATD